MTNNLILPTRFSDPCLYPSAFNSPALPPRPIILYSLRGPAPSSLSSMARYQAIGGHPERPSIRIAQGLTTTIYPCEHTRRLKSN